MEVMPAEQMIGGGSAQPVEIPQALSTHTQGMWPKVVINQSTSYKSDLVKKTYSVGGMNVVVWEESGIRSWAPEVSNPYSDPDDRVDKIFKAMSEVCVLYSGSESMSFERSGKVSKVKHFDLTQFTPPSPSEPLWRHMNYEHLIDVMISYANEMKTRPPPAGGAENQQITDWGGPSRMPDIGNFLRDRPSETDPANYNGSAYDVGVHTFASLTKTALGNRLETALVLDTPRKTASMWRFFNLIHSGYPWYSCAAYNGTWRNFKMTLEVRAPYEIFNSIVSKIPNVVTVLPDPISGESDLGMGPYADNLTYDPRMMDIGNTIMNIGLDVSNHVSSMLRKHIKMDSISYMESSALLMQMSQFSANKASSLSAFTATLNNSAASAAFEPVVNALSCAFTKISIDLPTNCRQATVMMVVGLMTYTGVIFDNQTRCLIHNMFVGMVMPTSVGLYQGYAKKESTIDFGAIRRFSSEHKLLPTPALPSVIDQGAMGPRRRGATMETLKVRDAMIRLLCHFHGVNYVSGINVLQLSTAKNVWDPSAGGFCRADGRPDIASENLRSHYFGKWGGMPKSIVDRNCYLSDLLPNGTGVSDTLVGSSFDMYLRGRRAPYVGRVSPIEVDYADENDPCFYWLNARAHGIPIRVLGVLDPELVRTAPDKKVLAFMSSQDAQVFSDDTPPFTRNVNWSDPNVITLSADQTDYTDTPPVQPNSKEYDAIPSDRRTSWSASMRNFFLFSESEVSYVPSPLDDRENATVKLRPRHSSILPELGSSDDRGTMSDSLKDFVAEVINPILDSVSTVGEIKYISNLGTLMFNQRWAQFMDYISTSATVTMLADYSPFGYTPLIVGAGEYTDARRPEALREEGSVCADSGVFRVELNPVPHIVMFSPAGVETRDMMPYFRYEREMQHKTVTLEPSHLLALALLGVAPTEPADLTGALTLNLDAKSFNHDIVIMRMAARMTLDIFNPQVHRQEQRFENRSPIHKMDKFKKVLTSVRSIFPASSPLTSSVEKSLDNYELRQNHYWRTSPWIDAEPSELMSETLDMRGAYQFPFLRHRPLIPLGNSGSHHSDVPGVEDTLFHQMKEISMPYLEHILSRSRFVRDILVLPTTLFVNDAARTRYEAPTVPMPLGVPYVSPIYFDSPLLDCRWLYAEGGVRTLDNAYNYHAALGASDDALSVRPVNPTRSHARVFSDWMNAERATVGTILFPYSIKNPSMFTLEWRQAAQIAAPPYSVPIPVPTDGVFPRIPVYAEFTTPQMYVSKPQEILDMGGVPSGLIPVLDPSQGPFISRFEPRSLAWPSGWDYRFEGSLTENVSERREDDDTSCEFNPEMIGVIPSRVKPISFIDPSSMLVLVKDPLAMWYRI